MHVFVLPINNYYHVSDVENIFHIIPGTVEVPAGQTALFEVIFDPNRRNSNLFASELVSYILPMQLKDNCYEETLAFVAMTSIRLIGIHIL